MPPRVRTILRWLYGAYILMALLYFPWRGGFRLNPKPCEFTFGFDLAIHSLTNYPHILMFTWFFVVTTIVVGASRNWFVWPALICLGMGLMVEFNEGLWGRGHCRMRDLIPDSAGIAFGSAIVLLWLKLIARRT